MGFSHFYHHNHQWSVPNANQEFNSLDSNKAGIHIPHINARSYIADEVLH